MKYLLDTNVLSEFRKGRRANVGVQRWFAATPSRDLYLSPLVVGEIRAGIEKLRPRDAAAALALDAWLAEVVTDYAQRIWVVDVAVAEIWAKLRAGRNLPMIDSLIAATALAHDATLVTRNVAEMRGTGVQPLNPFDDEPAPLA